MKKKILFWFLVSFTLLILIFCLQNFKQKKDENILFEKNNLPALYVDKNIIKRRDNGEQVQLKGVSSMAFAHIDGYHFDSFWNILAQVRLWKINLLGLFINPEALADKEEILEEIINWAEENYIYVYLSPVFSFDSDSISQVDTFLSMQSKLAKKYAKKNNLIFGLWAEPNAIEWEQWKKIAKKEARAILKEKPDALIAMTGVEYSRKFGDITDFPSNNIIFDFHDYPCANASSLADFLSKENTDFLWDKEKQNRPVLVGEFGGVWESDFGSNEDLNYMKKVLDEINKNKLSYLAYSIDSHLASKNLIGLDLINWSTGETTKKGELIKHDLEANPATDFSVK